MQEMTFGINNIIINTKLAKKSTLCNNANALLVRLLEEFRNMLQKGDMNHFSVALASK